MVCLRTLCTTTKHERPPRNCDATFYRSQNRISIGDFVSGRRIASSTWGGPGDLVAHQRSRSSCEKLYERFRIVNERLRILRRLAGHNRKWGDRVTDFSYPGSRAAWSPVRSAGGGPDDGEPRRQYLERDVAPKPGVAGEETLSRPIGAERADDPVVSEDTPVHMRSGYAGRGRGRAGAVTERVAGIFRARREVGGSSFHVTRCFARL